MYKGIAGLSASGPSLFELYITFEAHVAKSLLDGGYVLRVFNLLSISLYLFIFIFYVSFSFSRLTSIVQNCESDEVSYSLIMWHLPSFIYYIRAFLSL